MKGSAFTARFAYLQKHYLKQWPRLIESFDAPTAALARGPCLKASWYPFACFPDLNVRADRLCGRGDLALARAMGRDAAIVNLPTLYRMFYKVGSPEYVFNRVTNLWSQHHDTGRAEVVFHGRDEAEWRTIDFAAPHPALCRSLEGFITGSLELMGMREITVREESCVLAGAKWCTLRGWWKRP